MIETQKHFSGLPTTPKYPNRAQNYSNDPKIQKNKKFRKPKILHDGWFRPKEFLMSTKNIHFR